MLPMRLRSGAGRPVFILSLLLAAHGLLLTIPGCGVFDRGEDGTVDEQPPGFASEVYPALRSRCLACHAPGLPASATAFVLQTDAPGDYSMIRALVNPDKPEESRLLRKASGRDSHGGGAILGESSDEYKTILKWISSGALND